jgi:hypothetical protein
MSSATKRASIEVEENIVDLDDAFAAAMAFRPELRPSIAIDRASLQKLAEEEAAFGRVIVDERGLTAGAKLHALQPARRLLEDWQSIKNRFEAALGPKRLAIDALEQLEANLANLRNSVRDELAKAEELWSLNPHNKTIESDWSHAQAHYNEAKRRNDGRSANMFTASPLYLVVVLLVGVADWFLNCSTLLAFTGQAMVAAGATFVFAHLLAVGAHGHGAILKQWANRFYPLERRPGRTGAIRLAALTTISVLTVLIGTAWARYVVDVRVLAGTIDPNTIAPAILRHIDPTLDVAACLFLNSAVWMIGVLLSYVAHDVDPEFMEATRQHRRDGRRYYRARRRLTQVMERLEQQCSHQVMQLQVDTLSRSAEVARERGQYAHVVARDRAVATAVVEIARASVQQYKELLAQHILARGQVQIFATGPGRARELTAYDFMSQEVIIDAGLLATGQPAYPMDCSS